MEQRNRYRFANPHFILIQLLYWAAACGYYTFGAGYLFGKGLGSGAVGGVFAVTGVLSALAQPAVAGLKSRRLPTARLAAALTAPAALCLGLIPLVSAVWALVALYVLAWMLLICLQFLINAMAMEYQNAGIRLNYGVGRAFGSGGYALAGYLLGIFCAEYGLGLTVPYGAVMALLLLFALLLWPTPPEAEGEADSAKAPGPEDTRGFLRRYRRFSLYLCGSTLNMLAYCMACSYLIRIVENLGGGSKELGTATLICALCEIPTVFLSLRLNRRFGSRGLMNAASVMLSVKMLLIMLAPDLPFLYGAETLQMFSYSLFLSITVYYANALMGERDRLKGQAAMGLVQTVGNAGGALVGGLLLAAVGLTGMRVFCIAASCIGSVIMILGTEKV